MKHFYHRWIEIKIIPMLGTVISPGLVSLIISGILFISGCSTVINGFSQDISITSEPSGARITTNNGLSITTPGKLTLTRKKNYCLIAKHEKFETQHLRLYNQTSIGMAMVSGVFSRGLGKMIDNKSGANLKLVPKRICFNFKNPELSTVENPKLVESWAKKKLKEAAKSKLKAENSIKSTNKKLLQAKNNVEQAKKKLLKKETPKSQQKLESAIEKLATKKKKVAESQQSLDVINWRIEQTKKILKISEEVNVAIESKIKADKSAKSEAKMILQAEKSLEKAKKKANEKQNTKTQRALEVAIKELEKKRKTEEEAKKCLKIAYKKMKIIRQKLKAEEDLLISKEAWFD